MVRVFDFACARGHRFELFCHASTLDAACPECGTPAERVLTAPRIRLEGITGDFPTAADLWEKRREEKMRQERKQEQG